MKERKLREIKYIEKGQRAVDGAGVSLVRVLGHDTVDKFDPFLMLDSFDSRNPKDYMKGFPMHPHRGIETITYLSEGSIMHKDSLGNTGMIANGGVQWMTTGRGIMHEEMPQESERMLGVQLWLNLPKEHKLTKPAYYNIPKETISKIDIDGGKVRVIAGEYQGIHGHKGKFLPVEMYSINLEAEKSFVLETKADDFAFLFSLQGDIKVNGQEVEEKSAIALKEGDYVEINSKDQPVEVLYISAPSLKEPVAWGGPIVMNTRKELLEAFVDIESGKFVE